MENFLKICCVIAGIIVIGSIICKIYELSEAKKKRLTEIKRLMEDQRNRLLLQEDDIRNKIKQFFNFDSEPFYYTYSNVYESLNGIISNMKSTISQMKVINDKLVRESRRENQSAAIAQLESQTMSRVMGVSEGFKSFGTHIYAIQNSLMIEEESYGKINKDYWDSICVIERDDAINYIAQCEAVLDSNQTYKIYAIDIKEVIKCVWFFALEKTFSASDFKKAEKVFSRIYKYSHADVIIAGLYAKKKLGGEDALRDAVRDLLKSQTDTHILTLIASGFMWMNAYQSECAVLQHMLSSGKEMTAKTQERLHSLTNGGGKAPNGFDVHSSNDILYFDISALAWKEEEYIGLFENLAFQDKVLSYSLAVRDEDKDLFIHQGIDIPGVEAVLNKFRRTFSEEYGSGVTAKLIKGIALSGSGQEELEGILVSSKECEQMGMFLHIAKIGKKMIIKFYTLFLPKSSDLVVQKQQILSMYQKLSPSVTMWESSLKDTMLIAIEQLLNTTAQSSDNDLTGDMPREQPIF